MSRGAHAFVLAVVLAVGFSRARAADWELELDARLVSSDGEKSVLDGGFGALRFGDDKSGLQLGRVRFALSQNLGEVWSLHLDASDWGDHDKNPVDLTEAYLQWRPYPFDGLRLRVKAGAFYAPISLENREAGWESPYTLSSSAINTWVGEELRTVGVEGQLDWLGTHTGHVWDLGLTGAVYGWNDPAGVMLANTGFMLDDRQTTLFGRVGQVGSSPIPPAELFHEIDGRAGVYVGVEARYLDRVVVRALHYDNRADPAALDSGTGELAWLTRFNSAGIRVESAIGWTAIAQWLKGETFVQPDTIRLGFPFEAKFLLVSKRIGRHTLSARYDKFEVLTDFSSTEGDGAQYGHAWTLAYLFEPSAHWRFTLEWLDVRTDSSAREEYSGSAGFVAERKLEAAFRYSIGSAVK